MENKKIEFSNGYLEIEKERISFHHKRGLNRNVNTIARYNIGNVEIQNMRVLDGPTLIYIFRTALFGIIFFIIGLIVAFTSKLTLFLWVGNGLIIFSVFMLFSYFIIEVILGIHFVTRFFMRIYGVDATRIVIQNLSGGNNMLFFVHEKEKDKLPKFKDLKTEKIDTVQIVNQKNDIDDLAKLGELLKSGLITQEDFDKKKNQILGI